MAELRRTRVLEIVAWNSTRGGAEKHVVDLLRSLRRDEFELALACTPGGNLRDLAGELGVPWYPAPLFRARPDKGLWGIRHAIKAFAPDIVHAHGNRSMLYTIAVDRKSRRRLVFTHHGIAVTQVEGRRAKLQAVVERLARRRVARHITVSRADLEVAAEMRLLDRDRARVVHNGIAPLLPADGAEFRARFGIGPDVPVVLCVARFQPVKDHPNLLRAWPRTAAAFPLAKLVLVGRGREVDASVALAAALGITGATVFTGSLDNVAPAYAAADLLVLPSLGEGLPYTIIEAMSVGLPVVATRVGGVPECVEDGVTGILVPPSSPDELADAIIRMLGDEEMRARMGAAGKAKSAEFTLDVMAGNVAQVYREMMLAPSKA